MALTPAQQQLADVAQAGEANACCLALGGEIGTYPVTGEEICMMAGQNSFPLSDACGNITASLPSMESPGEEQGGGFFNWLGSNFTEFTSGVSNVIDSVQGNQQQPPGMAPGGQPIAGSGVTTTQAPGSGNTILYIVGGAMLLLVVFLLIRKRK